jgi:hypothetical protein
VKLARSDLAHRDQYNSRHDGRRTAEGLHAFVWVAGERPCSAGQPAGRDVVRFPRRNSHGRGPRGFLDAHGRARSRPARWPMALTDSGRREFRREWVQCSSSGFSLHQAVLVLAKPERLAECFAGRDCRAPSGGRFRELAAHDAIRQSPEHSKARAPASHAVGRTVDVSR